MEPATDPKPGANAPLRVGIAGFGLAGRVFHAPLVSVTPGLEVAAVVTGNPERAADVRESYPGAEVVGSVDDLWGGIDLLVVATPNRSHAELALAATSHDIPAVIDKPLASTVAEAEEVLAADGRITVFQNRRWDGDFLTVRRLVEEGRLGEVVRFESRFERFRPDATAGWRESSDPADGGGQLNDLGAHLVDQAIQLFGPVANIYAEVDTRRAGAKIDDDVFIALEHDGGVRSHLHMGKVAPLAGPRFRVAGLKAGFEVDGLDPQEKQLGEGLLPGKPGYGERPPGRLVAPSGETDVEIIAGRYENFYGGVEFWLREGTAPPVDARDSLEVMLILEEARKSAARPR